MSTLYIYTYICIDICAGKFSHFFGVLRDAANAFPILTEGFLATSACQIVEEKGVN